MTFKTCRPTSQRWKNKRGSRFARYSVRVRRHLPFLAVLGIAVALRVWGIGFGLPHTLTRPDEDAVFSIALRFFGRTLDPAFFHWPTLFMYTVAAGYVVYFNIGRLAGWFPFEISFVAAAPVYPAPLLLIARALSAASGVMTVWTVHRLGLLLFDRTRALIGALFLAVAALHVRNSHFGVTDVAATWLLTLSFLFTARFARTGARRDLVLSALWAGLAASTKYNAGLVALPGLWVIASGGCDRVSGWGFRVRLLLVYCVVAVVAFVAGTPYAVLDVRSFIAALAEVSARLRDGHAAMAGYGWVVHLRSSLYYGLGLPLLIAGIVGLVLYWWQDRRAGVLFALFPVVYFAVIGGGQTAFARYVIPLVPFLCLSAAHAAVALGGWIAGRSHAQPGPQSSRGQSPRCWQRRPRGRPSAPIDCCLAPTIA
jgi:4-amino-4-deoxy-L-arabinose transferase-like glycosyltransferase